MRKARPKVNTTEGLRLKVIAIDVSASADEVMDALIYWAYQLPREQWRDILHSYRKSKREGDRL